MAHDKPKVTIDLEEYNELLREKESLKGDEYVTMAKTAMASFLNNRLDPARSKEDLKRQGIIFTVTQTYGGEYTKDSFYLGKIKK